MRYAPRVASASRTTSSPGSRLVSPKAARSKVLSGQREPGQGAGSGVARGLSGEDGRQDVGLVERRTGETVDAPVVLGAVADGMDVRVRGAQLVVDDDARADVESGLDRQTDPGAHPAGEDDQVGVEHEAVGELDGRAAQAPDAALGVHLHAQGFEMRTQQQRCRWVDVTFHQVFALLGEHHPGAACREGAGGGDTEQPAADDHRVQAGSHRGGQRRAVVERTERVHSVGQFTAETAQGRQDRVRPGRQHQPAVRRRRAVRAVHEPPLPVDRHRPHTAPHRHTRQADHLGAVAPGEHVGEQHPVVRRVGLLAEHGDGHTGGDEPVRHSRTRRPAADHHGLCSHVRSLRVRCYPSGAPLFPTGNAALSAARPVL